MATDSDNDKNPVVNEIGGIKIRKENYIKIRYNQFEFERLVRIHLGTGVPFSKIIALSSQACPICENDHVAITIPLSLISVKKNYNKNNDDKR